MDQQGGLPPPNGGVPQSVPPEVASELSAIAQKLDDLLKKLGINKEGGDDSSPPPEKGLGDKGMDDKSMGAAGPPPNYQ